MYAVMRLGSHQYLVEPGQTVTVEKVDGEVGSEVTFSDILLVNQEGVVACSPTVKASVIGKIKAQQKGPKIRVYKKKRRKGYEKTLGHRQPYTTVEITRIEA